MAASRRQPPQGPHAARHPRADGKADPQAANRAPRQIDHHPAPAKGADVVQAEQSQTQEDERKCGAVVEPALAGQRKTQVVAVVRTAQLHVGRQHGIRGRERRSQQQCKSWRQSQPPMPSSRDAGDGQHHAKWSRA